MSILRQLLLRQQNRSYMDIHRSSPKWYALSTAAVGAALLLSLRLGGSIGPLIFGPFLLAVLASALVGGTGPGLLAAGLSLASRCLIAATQEQSLGPLAIVVWLGGCSGIEILYVCLIAARRGDEAALRRSEQRFRLLTETLPQLVWAAGPDGRATYFNRRWYEVTGLTPERSLGGAWSDNIHPEDRQRIIDAWNNAVRSGTIYEVECRHRCADGTYRWFLVQGLPSTDATSRVVEWFGTCTDIEGQKRAAAAVAEATRAKDEFLAVLSHELRTPLTPVLMAATALLDDRQSYPSLRPTLKMIRDNVRLEARLIDDLLDISRIARADGVSFRARRYPCPDRAGLGDLPGPDREQGSPSDVRPGGRRASRARRPGPFAAGALEPDRQRGEIHARGRTDRHPHALVRPGRLAIAVADNGIGIEPDHLPHLFDAFERGYGAAASHAAGLGLGLTISRSIVEAHGGTLRGTSDGRNRGATFRLELATATDPGESAELTAASPSPMRRHLRVLLAEDDAATVETAAKVLRGKGHLVRTATSLSGALEAASDEYDVLVSDIDLGDGSGLELMRHVRSRGDTPGIAMSGYATEDDVQQSREAGFAVHLAKPVTFESLESAIQQVTAARSSCPPP